MRHRLVKIGLFCLLGSSTALPCLAQRTIVVVRHADKIDNSDDAALSPTGEAKAKRLAHVLKDFGISAIYATQFKRTIQTATPLGDLLRIKVQPYEQKDIDGVVMVIRQKHPKEVVMV